MTIELSSPATIPAVILDGLYQTSFSLTVNPENGRFVIRGEAKPFGVDGEGNVVLTNDKKAHSHMNTDDFLTDAVAWAITNGQATDPADFQAQVDAAKTAINAAPPSLAESLAYYENNMRMLNKIIGTADVGGLI